MGVQSRRDNTNVAFVTYGLGASDLLAVIEQDVNRTADLKSATVMTKDPVTGKYSPLKHVSSVKARGQMICGANGGLLAAYQAISDGEFDITVDGVDYSITGLNFTGISALVEVATIINTAAMGAFTVEYDVGGDKYEFYSASKGLGSSISVLSAVSGGTGTDISGSSYLNGEDGTGVETAGTGGLDRPLGLYDGPDIAAADLVAGDIPDNVIIIGDCRIDSSLIVLENGLLLTTPIPDLGLTILLALNTLNIFAEDLTAISHFENA